MFRTMPLIAAAILMTGCAGMSEEACLATDWRTVGFEDGAAGRPAGTIGRYRQACADHGVSPDLESYRAGHADGVEIYCRPSRGFDVGRGGSIYQGVCPADLEPDFVAAYQSGRHLYELEASVRSIDNRIAGNVKAQENIKRDLAAITASIASGETTTEQRVLLVAEAAELGRRHGELSNENDALREERALAAVELEDYRQTVAFGF